MYTSSRTWVLSRVREKRQYQAINHARKKLCPNSPFWDNNFDLAAHKQEWEAGRQRKANQKMARYLVIAEERQKSQDSPFAIPPPLRPAFDGKKFDTNHSMVLSQETIFCPQWEDGKETVAQWPSRVEMKYEGDERISTERIHRRFLPMPRAEGNDTVNFQQRVVIDQYPFDEYYFPVPNAVDIFMRTHLIAELEFGDEEGEKALGKELMQMLDPQEQ